MSSDDDKKQLFLWAQRCLKLKAELLLNTRTLTPENYYTEKDRFFASTNYNPIYTYKKIPGTTLFNRIKILESDLKKLSLPKELRTYFNEYLNDLTTTAHAIESIGTKKFSYFAHRLFRDSLENINMVLQTALLIEPSLPPEKEILNAEEIAQEFRNTLLYQYNIPDVSIEFDDFNDHTIRVEPKRVVIGSKIRRKPKNVTRLIVHEIETHILQGYNLSQSKNPLVRLTKFADSLLFGEGMAVYNEHLTRTITPDIFDTYYYRLKAVQMLDLSFREIYTYISQFISSEKAYAITARVKRGMHNTADSGGYPKDASYLLGFHKIQEYIQSGSNLSFLYIGKVPQLTSMLLRHELLQNETIILPHFLTKQYTYFDLNTASLYKQT